jgi:hypothetical protein
VSRRTCACFKEIYDYLLPAPRSVPVPRSPAPRSAPLLSFFRKSRSPLRSRSLAFRPAPLHFPLRSRSAHMLWFQWPIQGGPPRPRPPPPWLDANNFFHYFCRKSTVSCRSTLPLPYLPRVVGRQNNRKNVPARTPEEYCRRAVFLQDFASKFSKIFRGLHANSHGGRRV